MIFKSEVRKKSVTEIRVNQRRCEEEQWRAMRSKRVGNCVIFVSRGWYHSIAHCLKIIREPNNAP